MSVYSFTLNSVSILAVTTFANQLQSGIFFLSFCSNSANDRISPFHVYQEKVRERKLLIISKIRLFTEAGIRSLRFFSRNPLFFFSLLFIFSRFNRITFMNPWSFCMLITQVNFTFEFLYRYEKKDYSLYTETNLCF